MWKKDDTLRVCIDYRQVNKDTVTDRYPMPRVDELVGAIGRSEDGRAVKAEDSLYLALPVPPFNLTNAPATFQRLMNKLFSGKEWESVFVDLDDILVVSASFEDHIEEVGCVLNKLKDAGLCLKPSKYLFIRKQVVYLVSSEGVTLNQEKVKAIVEYPQPTNCKSLRWFLGMLNFCRGHIQNLATLARPLTALTLKDPVSGDVLKFQWSKECESSFRGLKDTLVSEPVLYPPDLAEQFFVWTDASLSGVLKQLDDDGRRHLIIYASRQTSNAE